MGYEAHGLSKLVYDTAVAAGTQYYPDPDGAGCLEMGGRTVATLMLKTAAGTTTTIEATLMRGTPADGVAEEWKDITLSFQDLATGSGASASYTDTTAILQANGLNIHKLRIKSVTTGGASTEGYWLRAM